MQLKQYTQYKMNFNGKWVVVCASLMGSSMFLRFVYFFGFMNFADLRITEILFSMILGIALCGGFVFLLSWIRLNAPGLYGLMGCGCCLLLLVGSFFTGNALRMVFGIFWYIMAGAILLATVAGYLPGRVLSSVLFFIPIAVRLLFFDFGKLSIWQWAGELAALCMIGGLACLPMALIPTHAKPEHP